MSDEVLSPENDPDFIDTSADPRLQIPVYLYEKGMKLPDRGHYYVVAKDGIYIHMDARYGSALVKCDGIPWLESAHNDIQLSLPKIPGRIVAQALNFFRMVWKKYRSESEVTIYYSPTNRQYMLWCPTQRVTGASVNYDRLDRPDLDSLKAGGAADFHLVGTIHSHCNFSAFHSGTDVHDEDTEDGIHITLGHVDQDNFSMVASMAVGAGNAAGQHTVGTKKAACYREQMEPENCCLGIERVENSRVKRAGFMTWGDATYFTLNLSDEDKAGLEEDLKLIEAAWLPKVTNGWGGFDCQKKKGTTPSLSTGFRAARKADPKASLTLSSETSSETSADSPESSDNDPEFVD